MFVFGLIVGLLVGGVGTAFVVNQLNSSKVKALEANVAAAAAAIKKV